MLSASLIVVATLGVVIAVIVWRAAPDRELARRFGLFTSLFSLWALALAGVYSGWDSAGGIAFASASMGTALFISFARLYPAYSDYDDWLNRQIERIVLALGVGFAVLSLFTNLIVYGTMVAPGGLLRQQGPLYIAFAAYLSLGACIAVGILLQKLVHSRGLARIRLQYLTFGVLIAVTGGLSTNVLFPLLTGYSTYSWLGPLFGLGYVALVAHGIIRHRLMDLRFVVHRGLTIAIATTMSLAPVALLFVVVWPRLFTNLDGAERTLLLITVVIATLLAPVTRDLASRILDRYVYRTQANYRRTVTDASQMLTRMLDLKVLLQRIVATVMSSTGLEGVAIYLHDQAGCSLAASDRRNAIGLFGHPHHSPTHVLEVLDRFREPVIAEEAASEDARDTRALYKELHTHNWALVLPVQADNRLIGYIALGPKLSGDPFLPQDLDLLTTLSNQAGIAVKNAQLYAQVLLAHEYIKNIVATIESGVVAIDATGRITMFNRAAEALTGQSAERLINKPADTLPAPLAAPLLAALTDGRSKTIPEISLPDRHTETPEFRPAICTMSTLRDPAGEVLGAVAVLSDLTPVKELEAARRRVERLAYFELLASGIAHEIKNPLVSIKTFAQLLSRRQHDSRFIEEFGRIADREIGRMELLLERLRHLSRPQDRQVKAIDLRIPLQEALEILQAAFDSKSLAISACLGDKPRVIVGDHNDLESLFVNLLLNAQEATPRGGALVVELSSKDDVVTISVSDTGPGIPPHLLEQIFDPFITTKSRGSGLGLALCAGIAQGHGGKVSAANRPGGGAVFTVEFPLASKVTSPVPQ